MGLKDMFKKRDTLTDELRMLPRDTKKRILENVNRRRSEIIEERLLESQLKSLNSNKETKKTFGQFREGMRRRREKLKEKGILKGPVRYKRENFRSPMEEMSIKSRQNEIKRLEDQRNKLKSGHKLSGDFKLKIKDVKLKVPKGKGILSRKVKGGLGDGII